MTEVAAFSQHRDEGINERHKGRGEKQTELCEYFTTHTARCTASYLQTNRRGRCWPRDTTGQLAIEMMLENHRDQNTERDGGD